MKKLIIALIVAGLLVLSTAVPVFADGVNGRAVAAEASDGSNNQPTTNNPHNACVNTCDHRDKHDH